MVFANRYSRDNRVFIPEILVIHLESHGAQMGDNWKGRITLPFDYNKKSSIIVNFIMYKRRFKKFIIDTIFKYINK